LWQLWLFQAQTRISSGVFTQSGWPSQWSTTAV